MCRILDLIDETSDQIKSFLGELKEAHGKVARLDERCPTVWVSERVLVCRGGDCTRRLEYYGGFEYVTPEAKIGLGDYTVYVADRDKSGRVDEVIDYVLEREADEDYEGEEDED